MLSPDTHNNTTQLKLINKDNYKAFNAIPPVSPRNKNYHLEQWLKHPRSSKSHLIKNLPNFAPI